MANNEQQLDSFNDQMRSSPFWREWMSSQGINPDGPIKLSDSQRKQLQSAIAASGNAQFDKGMEIDQAGNMNQNEGFGKQAKRWGPIVAAGVGTALTAGGASPWLAASLGGGLGGATGAMDGGGWKGAALGGALGAAPGAIGALTRGGQGALAGANAATGGGNTGLLASSTFPGAAMFGPATGAMVSQGVSQGIPLAAMGSLLAGGAIPGAMQGLMGGPATAGMVSQGVSQGIPLSALGSLAGTIASKSLGSDTVAGNGAPGGGNPFMNFLKGASGLFGGAGGLIGAGTNILGGLLASNAAKDAAKQQEAMSREAMGLFQPYYQGGTAAFGKLSDMLMKQAAPTPESARGMFPVVTPPRVMRVGQGNL